MDPRSPISLDGYNQLAETPDGYLLYNKNDYYIGRSIAKYGEFSGLEMELFRQFCGPESVVIEVGANIGAHTVGLARAVGPRGRVLAFEPQRLVYQTLCANIALNSLENVDCYWSAVGRADSTLTVPELSPNRLSNFGGVSLETTSTAASMDVPCIILDKFEALPRLDFVKIDVEGMELDVIAGAERLLERFKPILHVENDRIDKSQALVEAIQRLGYRLYWHLPPLYNPGNFRKDPEDLFPGIISCNMLCIHRSTGMQVNGSPEIIDPSHHPYREAYEANRHVDAMAEPSKS